MRLHSYKKFSAQNHISVTVALVYFLLVVNLKCFESRSGLFVGSDNRQLSHHIFVWNHCRLKEDREKERREIKAEDDD